MQCWYDTKSFLHFLLIFKKNKLSWNTSPVFENIYTSLYEWASLIYWGMDIAKHSRHNYVSQLASFIDRLSGFIWQFMLFNWQFMRSVSAFMVWFSNPLLWIFLIDVGNFLKLESTSCSSCQEQRCIWQNTYLSCYCTNIWNEEFFPLYSHGVSRLYHSDTSD